MKKDTPLTIAFILTLIMVCVHAYLTSHFYDLKFGGATGDALCNVNSYINCDAVTASKYASLLGVPVALWGLFTNLIATFLFVFSRFNLSKDNEKTARYGFMMAAFMFVMSVIMGSISISAIGNICLFCVSAYILSLLTLVAAWMSVPIRGKQLARDIKDVFTSQRWVLGFLIVIPVGAYVANSMILEGRGFDKLSQVIEEKIAYWQVAPTQTFSDKGLVFYKGSGEPAMTIVEFADFRCPHCRDAYPAMHAFAASHPDVRLIFKTFPLDGTCNSAITGGGDGISCALAFIDYCGEKIAKKGWDVHNYIYDNQEDFRSSPVDVAADKVCKATGINCDDLKKCAKSDEALQEVKAMASEGERAKIQGTPSIFVNSKVLAAGQLLPVMDAAYKKVKAQ